MTKLYKNKNMIALFTSLSLTIFLTACAPSKNNNEMPNKEQLNQNEESQNKDEQIIESEQTIESEEIIEPHSEETKEETSDEKIKEYVDDLREEISELKEYSKEKKQSKEVQEKYNKAKEKTKALFDFIFNGKEINGITFKDLSKKGKQTAEEGFYELDNYIELFIPDYKKRFYDWTVDKGADALEEFDALKEWYNGYKEDVKEEYSGRSLSKKK